MSDLFVERRAPWYLLTGLVIGIILGVVYAYVIDPVEPVDNHPVTMREEFKDQYRALIAAAYMADGDVGRARVRLGLLGDADPSRKLALQAQVLSAAGDAETARAMGLLADALTKATPTPNLTPQAPEQAASVTPIAGENPNQTETEDPGDEGAATNTPVVLPSRTPTATQGAPFTLQEYQQVCDPDLGQPLIQVYVNDAAGRPVPGVQAIVTWEGGENRFYTGLKPEISLGYADFEMDIGGVYNLQLADGGEPVSGLSPVDCDPGAGEERFWGSWRVVYTQPLRATPTQEATPEETVTPAG